jgi:hypothetical protein
MIRDPAALRVLQTFRGLTAMGLVSLCGVACGAVSRGSADGVGSGAGGAQTGGGANVGAGAAAGGDASIVDVFGGGPRLRVLTQSEYKSAVTSLLGTISTPLDLPADLAVAGFVSIGASKVAVNARAVELYEAASRAVVAEVFGDAARWQALVGCQPPADLSDDCVVSFIRSAGKRAYRRDLLEGEVERWLKVGKDAAQLPGSSAAHGLAAVTSGLLQSPYFLYRVETSSLDASSGRLKYDGPSMATRLSFLLTGRPPSEALLAAAATGQLDTAEGVRSAAGPLLDDPSAAAQMAKFFRELSQADLVLLVQKSPELFPSFNAALQSSMVQATELFIQNIVLAPGADVRSFFDSDQTFVDATLAPIYGVPAPASGFTQLTLGLESGRAGILGQAAVVAGHSGADHTSPTRRGLFILQSLLCQTPSPPPDGVVTILEVDPNLTTRQKMELATSSEPCASCHRLVDPLGFALEHLDPIGQYRATENGLAIDTTGTLDGMAFDGVAQLGAALRQNPRALRCLTSNFYRDANGREDAAADSALIEALGERLASQGYVWRDLVAEFIVSDAFRSAPASTTASSQ